MALWVGVYNQATSVKNCNKNSSISTSPSENPKHKAKKIF